jgi:SET domain-containing protein
MMLVRTYLSNSSIEGVGIFSEEHIKKGDVIWRLEPKFDVFFNESEVDSLPPHMQDFVTRYGYPHLNKPGILVLELDNGRFMNHSLEPNTDFTRFDAGYAIRDIAPGEEITCNYFEFDPSFQGFFPPAAVHSRLNGIGTPAR